MICALILLAAFVVIALGPPSQPVPRRTVEMPPGTKVIGYYWIDDDLFVIYRPMAKGEHPENWEAPNVSIMSIDVPTVYIHETDANAAQRPRVASMGH